MGAQAVDVLVHPGVAPLPHHLEDVVVGGQEGALHSDPAGTVIVEEGAALPLDPQVREEYIRPVGLRRQVPGLPALPLPEGEKTEHRHDPQQHAADDPVGEHPSPGAVVQGDALLHPPVEPAHPPGGVGEAVEGPRHQRPHKEEKRRGGHPAHLELRPPPAEKRPGAAGHGGGHGKVEEEHQRHRHPGPHVVPPKGLESGGLLGRVGVELRGVAARRGGEHVDQAAAGHILPAAVLVHRHLLLGESRLFEKAGSGYLDAVAHVRRLPPDKAAEIGPPLLQEPPPGGHVAVELLIFADGVVVIVPPVAPVHVSASSMIFPSSTMRRSRSYSRRRAWRPWSVMA